MTEVKDKMDLIQSIFIDSKENSLATSDLNTLNKSLLKTNPEFTSLAYEAAAMGVAINSIKLTNSLKSWTNFYQEYGQNHAAQIHVGLGWALSELNLKAAEYIQNLEPIYKYRVIDGFGYHEGRFKRRQAVRTQKIPVELDENGIRAYNQGLGRSFWYTAQGEPEKLSKLITIFPKERHFDMWRGAGVAVAYVGGINALTLKSLLDYSQTNQNAFKCGIALAIQSREKATTSTKETEVTSKSIFNLTCSEVAKKLTELEQNANTDNLFFNWISQIEQNI